MASRLEEALKAAKRQLPAAFTEQLECTIPENGILDEPASLPFFDLGKDDLSLLVEHTGPSEANEEEVAEGLVW